MHTLHRRYQYSKLFDVYDGATSNATSVERAGYFYYINILSLLRFGYADEDERVWFEGRYGSSKLKVSPALPQLLPPPPLPPSTPSASPRISFSLPGTMAPARV